MALPIKIKMRCSLCGNKFVWAHEGWPDECPVCERYIGTDKEPGVAAPFIALRGNKTPDLVYRQMEEASERRMEMAAQMTGMPKSDFSAMKITDMRDDARPGENSAPKLSTAQNQLLQQTMAQSAGPAAAEMARQSIRERPGGTGATVQQLQNIRETHARGAEAAVAASCVGRGN